ncbi:MAG: ferric reductase-like transmembrane domain-containing protein [Pseudomonadota bacterium]
MRIALIWGALVLLIGVPIALAAQSPYLAFRQPIYIMAGFAGIVGLGLLVLQPLLAARLLPGLTPPRARRLHSFVGMALVAAVAVHVAGLWVFSPPDVLDAFLLRSPTPFSTWGVIAMWAIFAAACLGFLRRRLGLGPQTWRRSHTALATITVLGTVLHALLIEGTMEPVSKAVLAVLALGATLKALIDLRVWTRRPR